MTSIAADAAAGSGPGKAKKKKRLRDGEPFGMIPVRILKRRKEFGSSGLVVYGYVAAKVDADGSTFCHYKTIAKELDLSVDTVIRAIEAFEAVGEATRTRRGRGYRTTLTAFAQLAAPMRPIEGVTLSASDAGQSAHVPDDSPQGCGSTVRMGAGCNEPELLNKSTRTRTPPNPPRGERAQARESLDLIDSEDDWRSILGDAGQDESDADSAMVDSFQVERETKGNGSFVSTSIDSTEWDDPPWTPLVPALRVQRERENPYWQSDWFMVPDFEWVRDHFPDPGDEERAMVAWREKDVRAIRSDPVSGAAFRAHLDAIEDAVERGEAVMAFSTWIEAEGWTWPIVASEQDDDAGDDDEATPPDDGEAWPVPMPVPVAGVAGDDHYTR